jgi:HlyD family secretion protein
MKKKVIAAIVIAAVLFGGIGIFFLLNDNVQKSTVSQADTKDIVESIDVTGEVQPARICAAMSETGGKVARVLVSEGANISEGTVLFTLDDGATQNMLEEARAELSQKQSVSASGTIDGSSDALQRARAVIALAQSAGYDYDTFNRELEKAGLPADAQAGTDASLAMAAAQDPALAPLEARVAQLEAQLDKLAVKSTIAGTVLRCDIREGDLLAALTPAVTVGDLSRLIIKVQINEKDLQSIKTGQKVLITSEARAGSWSGTVSRVPPMAERVQASFGSETVGEVEITPEKPFCALPGTSAGISIVMDEAEGACTVPVESIVREAGETFVYVIEEGTAKKRSIVTGLSDGFDTQVLEGIAPGEKVVVSPDDDIKDGVRVKAVD